MSLKNNVTSNLEVTPQKNVQISMSGLIHHNFHSVKSKNRLGISSETADLEM